jgi:hypothetical protein
MPFSQLQASKVYTKSSTLWRYLRIWHILTSFNHTDITKSAVQQHLAKLRSTAGGSDPKSPAKGTGKKRSRPVKKNGGDDDEYTEKSSPAKRQNTKSKRAVKEMTSSGIEDESLEDEAVDVSSPPTERAMTPMKGEEEDKDDLDTSDEVMGEQMARVNHVLEDIIA